MCGDGIGAKNSVSWLGLVITAVMLIILEEQVHCCQPNCSQSQQNTRLQVSMLQAAAGMRRRRCSTLQTHCVSAKGLFLVIPASALYVAAASAQPYRLWLRRAVRVYMWHVC